MELPSVVFEDMPDKEDDYECDSGEVESCYSEDGIEIDEPFVGADCDDMSLGIGAELPCTYCV